MQTQSNRHKHGFAIAIVLLALLGVGVYGWHTKQPSQPPASAKPVAYDDPLHPAPGTQHIDIVVRDDKLKSGPRRIDSVKGGAILLNFDMYGNHDEYDIYIDGNNVDSEIDTQPAAGEITGQIYLNTGKTGTFEYGYHTDRNGPHTKLGTLVVH